MRRKAERHLTRDADRPDLGAAIAKPAEMTWRDYLVLLVRIGAEIEHALMVEYLYAAYSLGGQQVPEHWGARYRRRGALTAYKDQRFRQYGS